MEEDILKEIERMEKEGKSNEIVEIDENEEITNTLYDIPKVEEDKKSKKNKKPSKWSKLTKKQKTIIIMGIVIVLLIIITVVVYLLVFRNKDNKKPTKEEPLVVLEKDNYRYEDGILILLDENKKELGKYECKNKDEELCYVAYFSNEDEFDVPKKVYENGTRVNISSDIYEDNFVFIYDDTKKEDGKINLYNIGDKKVVDDYTLIKEVKENRVIVKKDGKYGLLSFKDSDISTDIKLNYEYMGYIEDTESLVISTNGNYQLIDFTGEEVSKTVPGKIKNFDKENISVDVSGKYYVYGYDGKSKLDSLDYIRFVDSYIIGADNKKLYIYDKYGSKMSGDGIRVSSTSYNTKLIFNDKLEQTGKEVLFDAYIDGSKLTIDLGEEKVNINLNEGKFNKNLSYINYFSGKLYFYSDEDKKELIGTYACTYANAIDEGTNNLTNCGIAKKSNIVTNSDTLGYLPIFNKRYVFIADTKSPNAFDNIILWDLKTGKKMATYKAVDIINIETNEFITHSDTAGTMVVAKNTNDSYGVVNIKTSSVDGVIPFKDKDNNTTNVEIKLVNDNFMIKRNDGNYYLYDLSGNKITSDGITDEIVEIRGNYIKVKTSNNKYKIFSKDGKVICGDEQNYIILEDNFYINVDKNNKIGLYKYDNKNLINEDIIIDGKDYAKEIKYGLRGNVLVLTYVTGGVTEVKEIAIGG